MRVAPVSADLLIKLGLVAVGIGVAVWAVRRVTGAVSDAASNAWSAVDAAAAYVRDGTRELWNGPADAPDRYQALLDATKADTRLNPFIHNPTNVKPEDLIPAGYRVNQWGGLEPINTGGATGSW